MNKKNFDTLDDLENFIESFPADPKCIFDIQKLGTGEGFLLQWQEQKYYTAQDGKVYPDEVWITKEGAPIQVQDISEEHLRNIVRMIIRNDRKYQEQYEQAMKKLENTILSTLEVDDDPDSDPDTESITLH